NSGSSEFLCELRADAGRGERTDRASVRRNSLLFEDEHVLHADHVIFHAGNFGDVSQTPSSVTETCNLHYQGDGRCDLLANGLLRQIEVCHQRHGLHACDSIARAVGVDGGQGAVMAGVHGLQHVKGFFATHLAHDDAVRAHTQTVDYQLALHDRTLTFYVGRTALQADYVTLLHLQLGGVLDGD